MKFCSFELKSKVVGLKKMVDTNFKLPVLGNPKDLRSRTIQSPQFSKCQSLLNFQSEIIKNPRRRSKQTKIETIKNKSKNANLAESTSYFGQEKYYEASYIPKNKTSNRGYSQLESDMVASYREKKQTDRHKMSNMASLQVDETLRRYLSNWSTSWDADLAVNMSREKLDEPIRPRKNQLFQYEEESYIYYPAENLPVIQDESYLFDQKNFGSELNVDQSEFFVSFKYTVLNF